MKKISFLFYLIILFNLCNENPASTDIDEPILASYNKSEVENMAQSLQNDANLLTIKSDDVNLNGKSISWCYLYYSFSEDSRYYFKTNSKEVELDSTRNGAIDGLSFITHTWFDSNEAIEIAEENGGEEFRSENQEYIIEASLSEPLVPNTSTIWYIEYRSKINESLGILLGINANTGEVLLKYPE